MLYRLVRPMRREGSRNVYFRQRIPADIKPLLLASGRPLEFQVGGEMIPPIHVTERTEAIRFSLRSANPDEVRLRQAEATRQVEMLWKALRQTEPVSLDHRQCVALAGRVYQAWASELRRETTTAMVRVAVTTGLKDGEAAAQWRWEPSSTNDIDAEPEVWAAAAKDVDDPDKLGPLADRLLMNEGINGHVVDDASREMLLKEIAKALRQAFEHRQRNAEGDYRADPHAERFPPSVSLSSSPSPSSAKGRISLKGLVEDWWREAKAVGRKPSTYESYSNSMAALVAFLKHDDAGRVTPEDIVRFKDHRLATINPRTKKPISAKTVKDSDLAGLKTVFGWGVGNRKLPSNPAEGIPLKLGKKVKLRDKWLTEDETTALLRASLAVDPVNTPTKAALRWVPWLAAYSGARVGELVQLRKEDVRREEGHWVIVLTPEAGTIKTNEARTVVLHPHVIERKFIAFVESAPAGYLFLRADLGDDIRGVWEATKNRLREFVRNRPA